MPSIVPSKYFMMVTESCNCSCDYCYIESNPKKMGSEVLEVAIQEIMAHSKNPLFMWYGCEPMLGGIDFFKKVVDLQEKIRTKRRNLIQTNLTLQNRELIEFLLENQFTISTSIDGPKEVHDQRRKFSSGKSTFDDIIENIHFIKEKGSNPWAICVVSSSNVKIPNQVYEFFNGERINVRFCPEVGTMGDVKPEQYSWFISQIYSRWNEPTNRIRVSNFNKAKQTIKTGEVQECDNMKDCLIENLGINTNGDAYPCNRFVGREEFVLGNIQNGLISILNSNRHRELSERGSLIGCDCSSLNLLYGGCMFNSYVQTGNWKQIDKFCQANRTILELFQGNYHE